MKTIITFSYRILTLCFCLISIMLTGCVKNEFKVEFEFPKEHIGNYLMTYYAWDKRGGRWMEHTVSIQEGKAMADGITRLPTLVYISDASRPGTSMAVYVERGDKISISGEGKDMTEWTVKGNKLSEQWSEWRKSAYAKKSDIKAFHKSIEEYVKAHPKDELSAILLLTEWNRREDPMGFIGLWNQIDKGSRSPQLIEMSGVSDLLGVEFITNAEGKLEYAKEGKMKKILLRSKDNGLDTLRFTKPTFLYFYGENNAARREAVDSMKTLSKAYPDSAKRNLADIYVDSDSITWINAIRRDSLKTAVRAWQPRGLVEDDMVRLGITRLPWFVVKDKDAKEVYAGSDLKEAVAAFRKIAGKPDPKGAKENAKKESKDKSKTEQESAKVLTPKPAPLQKEKPSASRPLKPQKISK